MDSDPTPAMNAVSQRVKNPNYMAIFLCFFMVYILQNTVVVGGEEVVRLHGEN